VKLCSSNTRPPSAGTSTSPGCLVALCCSLWSAESFPKARLVVVVGMPYPNPNDVLIKERLHFFRSRAGEEAAQRFLDDMCMKSVNQSIGRSIRHRNDYSAIVLADVRYSREHILHRLPGWLRAQAKPSNFPQTTAALAAFFAKHRAEQQCLYEQRLSAK